MSYGFEDGQVIKIGGVYHMITVEFVINLSDTSPDARFSKTNIAHWTSLDRVKWNREETLLASSGDRSGLDPRAVYSSVQPFFNVELQRWELFYDSYRSQGESCPYPPEAGHCDPNPWLFPALSVPDLHRYFEYGSRILRARSEAFGLEGIGGPYREIGWVMQTEVNSQPWEGLVGIDSFVPYRAGGNWYAFYGSDHTEGSLNGNPYSGRLMVGLASATSLDGPWTRMTGNPLFQIEPISIENPIVYHLSDETFIAIYNAPGWPNYDVGYTTSTDGVHWSAGKHLRLAPQWATSVRTPLSLIAEPDGTFTLIFTAATGSLDAWADSYHMAVGLAEVNIE